MKFEGKGPGDKMTLVAIHRTGILCLNENPHLLACELQDVPSVAWRRSQEKDVCFHGFESLF